MKRFIAVLLTALIAFGLCSCGSGNAGSSEAADSGSDTVDSAAIHDSFEKAVAYVEPYLKDSGMTSSKQEGADGTSVYMHWLNDSYDGNDDFDMDISVDGINVTIGKTKVSELKNTDFEIQTSGDAVAPGAIGSVILIKNGNYCTFATEKNLTDKDCPIDELTIGDFSNGMGDNYLPFTYSGLGDKSALQDVIEVFGTPKYSVTISASAVGTVITVRYSRKGQDGDAAYSDDLYLNLNYDADKDIATIGNIQIGRTYQV